jgi:hypothetical protein
MYFTHAYENWIVSNITHSKCSHDMCIYFATLLLLAPFSWGCLSLIGIWYYSCVCMVDRKRVSIARWPCSTSVQK